MNGQNLIQALTEKQSDKIEIDLAPNLIKIDQNCHCAGACGGDLGGGVLIRPGQASAVPLSLPPNERAAWLAHSPLLAQMRGRLARIITASLHILSPHRWATPEPGRRLDGNQKIGRLCRGRRAYVRSATGHSVMSAISSSVAAPLLEALPGGAFVVRPARLPARVRSLCGCGR